MAKTFMEMSAEIVTAMVSRNLLIVQRDRGEDWKKFNERSVRTVGWAFLEMYKEVSRTPGRAWRELEEKGEKQAAQAAKRGLIISARG